jgi:hypothetical protein
MFELLTGCEHEIRRRKRSDVTVEKRILCLLKFIQDRKTPFYLEKKYGFNFQKGA